MSISVLCLQCGARSSAPDAAAGRSLPCPTCSQALTVPVPTPKPTAPAEMPAADQLPWCYTAAQVSVIIAGISGTVTFTVLTLLFGIAALGSLSDRSQNSPTNMFLSYAVSSVGGLLATVALMFVALVVIDAARQMRRAK